VIGWGRGDVVVGARGVVRGEASTDKSRRPRGRWVVHGEVGRPRGSRCLRGWGVPVWWAGERGGEFCGGVAIGGI
jgi:hypothetical protein